MLHPKSRTLPLSPRPSLFARLVWTALLLLLLAGLGWLFFTFRCLDGCGPYRNTASAVDLDSDGDLDVLLSNLRHEGNTCFWAGATLWINQGKGRFTPVRTEYYGASAAAGDLDGDGDADLLSLGSEGSLYINQGGAQGGKPGDFAAGHTIRPQEGLIYPNSHGSVALGDLNNDGRLDAFIGQCCGTVWKRTGGTETTYPSLAWVWINTPDRSGGSDGQTISLAALGDLPMRPTLGDLDGDGSLDVFAAVQPLMGGDGTLPGDRVLLNDGSGSFRDSGQRLGEGILQRSAPLSLAALLSGDPGAWAEHTDRTAAALGDLDGDGDLDALVGRSTGAQLWINQGGAQHGKPGTFAASGQRLPDMNDAGEAVFLADLDGDGDLDALLGGKTQAAIWWNDGPGGFRDSGQRLRYSERHGLAVGDFNGDGHMDVFAAAYDAGFQLWLNPGDGRLLEAN